MHIHTFFLWLGLLAGTCTALSAQRPPAAGAWTFAAGIGAVPTFLKGANTVDVPPLSARIGYRPQAHWSVEAFAAYSAATSHTDYRSDGILFPLRHDAYMGGVRTSFHRTWTDRVELYGGALLGYHLPVISQVGTDRPVVIPHGKPHRYRLPEARVFFSGFVGGNFRLAPRVAAYGELGFGISLLQLGLRYHWR